MSDSFWIAFGSIGSTAGFAAIAWQAYLTREALKDSRASLALTRASVKVSELIAANGIRSRLDAQAPEVTVQLSAPPWEPLAWSNTGMPCNTWPHGQTWHFPAQQAGSNRIALQQVLVVENHSNRRVQVRFNGDLYIPDENKRPLPAGVLLLEPGEKSPEVYLQRDFTIKELSENYELRAADPDAELTHKVAGTVTVEDDRDNGSTDVWDLVLTGCPVEPVRDRDGMWKVVGFHISEGEGLRSLDYSLLPSRQRIHWVSRTKKIRLPSMDSVQPPQD